MMVCREWAWAALAAAVLTGALGTLAMLADHAWLFPSLGPSIMMQSYIPDARESRLYNTVVGQGLGVLAGTLAVLSVGMLNQPSELLTGTLLFGQVVAAVISVVLTLLLQVFLRAIHPPAASTALLMATGGFHVATSDLLTIGTGILLVGALGEPVRRWRAVQER